MWKGSYGKFEIVETYVDSCMYIISNMGLTFNKNNYERIVVSTELIPDGSTNDPDNIVSIITPPNTGSARYTFSYIEGLEEGQDYLFYAYAQAVKNKWYPDGIHGQYFLLGEQTLFTEREPEYGEFELGKGFAYGSTKLLLDTDHPFMLHLDVTDKGEDFISVAWTEQERIKVYGLPEHVEMAKKLHNSKYDFSGGDYSDIRRSDLVLGWYGVEGGVSLLEQNRALRLWGNDEEVLSNIYSYRSDDYYKYIDCTIQGVLLCLELEPIFMETKNLDITVRFIEPMRGRRRITEDLSDQEIRELFKRIRIV